jgi:uncharacterized membrane protein (DUF2068 family)
LEPRSRRGLTTSQILSTTDRTETGPGSSTDPSGRASGAPDKPAPGTERPRRFRPSLRYELIGCGLHGHELLGTDAERLRPSDGLFARQDTGGFRWYRCLRCDAWLPMPSPEKPAVETPPERGEVQLPLRGRPLRDRYVLRLIAVERSIHFLVLAALAVAIFAFATHRDLLHHEYTRILSDLQGGLGGPIISNRSTLVLDLNRLFALSVTELYLAGAAVSAYCVVLAFEMVGLWLARRWAAYLTIIETGILVPVEIYELVQGYSWLKILTLLINVAVVLYLLIAHRLFGLRGGGAAARAMHEHDTGWAPLERATPPAMRVPSVSTASVGSPVSDPTGVGVAEPGVAPVGDP